MQQDIQIPHISQSIVVQNLKIEEDGEKMQYPISYYQLGRYFGRNLYGHSYEARKYRGTSEDDLGVEIVLKQVVGKEDPKLAEQIYQNEIRTLKLLKQIGSNQFSKCLNHWKHEDKFYICLEKNEFGNLKQLVEYLKDKKQEFHEQQIIYFLRQILKAVQILQENHIIHRNLKPQNIEIGDNMSIKITDFSLSKNNNDEQILNITQCGTPYYVAPQVFKENNRNWSRKIDVYSIGIIIYCMINLKEPFEGKNRKELVKVVKKGVKVAQKSKLGEILEKMVDIDPKKRLNIKKLLQDSIFGQKGNQNELKNRIKERFHEYFQLRNKHKYGWKRQICFTRIQYLQQHIKRLINQSKQKVLILKLIHKRKFGYFVLLSNLSILGLFNNGNIIKYSKLQKPHNQSNQEKILSWVYQKYFSSIIQSMKTNQKRFEQPNCSIKRLIVVNQNVFIRLSNNVVQFFFAQVPLKKSKDNQDCRFILSADMNYHTKQTNSIKVKFDDSQITYSNCNEGMKSCHKDYLKYIQQTLQILLDDSIISQPNVHK